MADSGYRWQEKDLLLRIWLQPRASRNEIVGLHGDEIKLRLTAPPLDNKANTQLRRFLAREFGVRPGQVELRHGHSSRHKRVCIRQPARLPEWLTTLSER